MLDDPKQFIVKISTHTLTWSVTRDFFSIISIGKNFNSHAHVERDVFTRSEAETFRISTHTLTWSVTISVKGLLL